MNKYITLDMTFCASPNCKNECGRQWTKDHEAAALRVGKTLHAFAYFCGEQEVNPVQPLTEGDTHE